MKRSTVVWATISVALVMVVALVAARVLRSDVGDNSVDLTAQQQIIFIDTSGQNFRRIASVPMAAPDGERRLDDDVCDRLAVRGGYASCLTSTYGVADTYEAVVRRTETRDGVRWDLPGYPSRTSLSPSGRLVATTVFVSGHEYADGEYSTHTEIHASDGGDPDWGNLESFQIIKDGHSYESRDVNVWGVTFRSEDEFYATVSTQDVPFLARGSLDDRTLTLLYPEVECPSLSPDGEMIAYKRPTRHPGVWRLHVMDLKTGDHHALAETRNVDDQVQWLNDTTIIYGLFRPQEIPVTDVWQVPSSGAGEPTILIANAASPSVIP